MLRVADGLSVLSKGIGKVGLRLPYDYMVAAMPYLGLPIVFDSGLSGLITDFIFGKDGEAASIMKRLLANDNVFNIRNGDEIIQSRETLNLYYGNYKKPTNTASQNIFDTFKQPLTAKSVSPLLRNASFSRWFARNLSEWHSRPAQQEMYYVTFGIPSKVKDYTLTSGNLLAAFSDFNIKSLEGGDLSDNFAFQFLDTENLMNKEFLGCYFVTGITTPVDEISIGFTDRPDGQRHLSPNLIIEDRKFDHLTALSIRFMETNVSIVDTFLRPWLKVISHLGLTEDDFKCNITVYQFSKNSFDTDPLIRKVWTYYNAFPIRVSEQELQRGSKSELAEYQVTWGFGSYEVVNYQPKWGAIEARPNSSGLGSFLV